MNHAISCLLHTITIQGIIILFFPLCVYKTYEENTLKHIIFIIVANIINLLFMLNCFERLKIFL